MTDAIVVFARAPVPGQVKTRLAQKVGADTAAAVYREMLHDTMGLAKQAARSWGDAEAWLAYTPDDAMLPGPHSLGFWTGRSLPQCAGDLGTRMLTCIEQLQAAGAGCVVIIGSDSPQIPPSVIGHALARLYRTRWHVDDSRLAHPCDMVLGPATDGGFYLIGVSRAVPPELFEGVQWSSRHARSRVEANAEKLGLSVARVWKYDDVDTYEDLVKLARRCPRYERFLVPQNA